MRPETESPIPLGRIADISSLAEIDGGRCITGGTRLERIVTRPITNRAAPASLAALGKLSQMSRQNADPASGTTASAKMRRADLHGADLRGLMSCCLFPIWFTVRIAYDAIKSKGGRQTQCRFDFE